MNPIKNVTDPHNIKESEIPNNNEAKPAGDIGVVAGGLLNGGGGGRWYIAGELSEN